MANRDSQAVMGPANVAPMLDLYRRVQQLEKQVRDLQARGEQMLPADFRYQRVAFGGSMAVVILRVSTGNAEQITAPL